MTDDAYPLLPPHEQSTLYKLARLRRQRWMAPVAPILFFLATALFAHFAAIHGWIELCLWFSDYATILLSVALLGVFTLLFYSLTGYLRLACAMTFVVTFTASLAHWMKVAVRGGPLYPWDLALIGETAHVMDWSCLLGYWPNLIMLILVTPAVVLAWLALPRLPRGKILPRLVALVVCGAFFASLPFPEYSALRPFHNRILQRTWTQNQSYARAGVLLAFIAQIQNYFVPEPDGYDEAAVVDLLEPYARPTSQPAASSPPIENVNVILVLSESFWDPTVLPGVTYGDGDPIPTFHRLAREFGRVDMVCPVFGGGTCDSELEVLSGCNMAFFPHGSAPYKYYIRKPLPSLASILRKRGYFTAAIHAVSESYFNDCEVQPRLGFEDFHPATEWDHVDKIEYYITDRATCTEAIRVADQAAKQNKPFFISVNTMETHWPYPPDRYHNRVELANLKAPGLSAKSRAMLETYVCGLRKADASLKLLVDHFANDPRPTVIVFYGDHLASLGEGYDFYHEAGLANGDDTDPLLFRTVPAVFWGNCGIMLSSEDRTRISMCYLAPMILRTVRQPMPPFFHFLEACREQYPVFSISGCVDAKGDHVATDTVLKSKFGGDYRLLQYDRVFGGQYFRKYAGPPPPSDPQNPFDN